MKADKFKMIKSELKFENGNVKRVAAKLGMSESTVYRVRKHKTHKSLMTPETVDQKLTKMLESSDVTGFEDLMMTRSDRIKQRLKSMFAR